jgi:hypothetical protein
MPAVSRGRTTVTLVRRTAVSIACAACVAGCASTASDTLTVASASSAPATSAAPVASASAPVPASAAVPSAHAPSDPGCVKTLSAVSTYGPAIVQDDVEVKKTVDEAEIDLIVLVLDAAAKAAGDLAARQSISNLANAYLRFRDAWTGAAAPPVEAILADTSRLQSVCSRS